MNLIILASALIISFVIAIAINSSNHKDAKAMSDFFEKEHKANFVRKKPLDDLKYISIPEEFYSYNYPDMSNPNGKTQDAYDMLVNLKDAKIVNFNGISNTDLKLEYGTANITVLSEYDQNYTTLVRILHTLGESLLSSDDALDKEHGKNILLYSIDIKSDMSKTYKLLSDTYSEEKNVMAIQKLIEKAGELNSPMAPSIIRYLQDAMWNMEPNNNKED